MKCCTSGWDPQACIKICKTSPKEKKKPLTTLMTVASTRSTVQHRQFRLSPAPGCMLCARKRRQLLEMYSKFRAGCTFSVLQSQALKHLIIYLNGGTQKPTAEPKTCMISNEG